jgi:hypothetical protein
MLPMKSARGIATIGSRPEIISAPATNSAKG